MHALIGGKLGVDVGLIGVWVVNIVSPTLTGSIGSGVATAAGRGTGAGTGAAGTGSRAGGFGGGGGGFGGGGGAFAGVRRASATTADIALHAPVTLWIIVGAVALAILGGLIAGAIGGWRASRLRPAAALRSVA